MYRVFNCGIGMTIQLPRRRDAAIALLAAGQEALVIGEDGRFTQASSSFDEPNTPRLAV